MLACIGDAGAHERAWARQGSGLDFLFIKSEETTRRVACRHARPSRALSSFKSSSEREHPTLELLDRMFATADWFTAFLNHVLNKPLSLDCSDHCPLVLQLHALLGTRKRFRFESF